MLPTWLELLNLGHTRFPYPRSNYLLASGECPATDRSASHLAGVAPSFFLTLTSVLVLNKYLITTLFTLMGHLSAFSINSYAQGASLAHEMDRKSLVAKIPDHGMHLRE